MFTAPVKFKSKENWLPLDFALVKTMAVCPCTMEDTLDYDSNSKGGHFKKKKTRSLDPQLK